MHSALYEFFRDQGSILAGILALMAGIIAYLGVWQQSRQLKNEVRRQLARESLIATRLLDGVLSRMQQDVVAVKKLLEQPLYFNNPNAVVPGDWKTLIQKPALSVVWDNLGMCGQSVIDNYLSLDTKIDRFAKREIGGVDYMKNMLAEFTILIDVLRDELAKDARRCVEFLAANVISDSLEGVST